MLRRFTFRRTARTLLAAASLALFANCALAQSLNTYRATVVEQVGQVSIKDGGYRIPLSKGDWIKPQQVIVTGPDGYARFQVADGSTFEVFPNAHVVFRQAIGNWKDLLNVILGRVKVFIQHAPGVRNDNEVSSPTAVISVRGTVFDVQVEDTDGTTLVLVDEGTVWVRNTTAPGGVKVLEQGEYVRVFRGQPLLAKQMDNRGILRGILKTAEDLMYQVALQRQSGGVGSAPVPGGGAQGDKGKGGGTTTAPPPPGTAPSPPGTAPPPPGGN